MRDDRNGAPNGRPSPFSLHTNGTRTNGVAQPDNPLTRLPAGGDEAPIDLVAVQADDELVNALAARPAMPVGSGRPPVEGRDAGGGSTDDRLVAMLAAWRAEIEAEPIPELVDLDAAVAAVVAGVRAKEAADRRKRAGRLRQLAPLAAAAAIIVATVTGVGLGSGDAMPGDVLWPIQKVVNPERAESVETKIAIEGRLQNVRDALTQGDTDRAAEELEAIRAEIPDVRGEDGQTLLVQEQEFLTAKLADAPPGTPVDLTMPPTSNPAALPTGVPAPPPPASDVPPPDPAVTGSSGSVAPSEPSPTDPGAGASSPDQASVPALPVQPDGSGPVVTEPDPSAPQVTSEPEVTQPQPNPGSDPGNSEGGEDGTTAPGTVDEPQPSGSDQGAGAGDGGTTTTTADTTTASGSAGASVEATATDTTS